MSPLPPASALGPPNAPFIELCFAPNLLLVGRVRAFVSDFYDEILSDAELVSRLALATHEVLENAVKYSVDGMTRIRIDYLPDEARIVLRTWNHPSPKDLQAAQELIAELQHGDPQENYQRLIRRTSTRGDGSGLGLGRVRAEADMSLACDLEGGTICVTATAAMGRR